MRVLTATLLSAALALTTLVATASDAPPALNGSAENIVKYRHTHMELMGRHSKTMRMILKGEVPFKEDLAGHAAALNALSQNIPAMFPAGTGPDKLKSESKPAIWAQWAKFVEASNTMKTASGKLMEATKGTDMAAINAAMTETGKACGGCHDTFKVED